MPFMESFENEGIHETATYSSLFRATLSTLILNSPSTARLPMTAWAWPIIPHVRSSRSFGASVLISAARPKSHRLYPRRGKADVTDHRAEVVPAHNDIDHLMQFGRASMIRLGLRVLVFARA